MTRLTTGEVQTNTIVGDAGEYTYSSDTWDNMMQDGYGGDVIDGPDDSLLCGGPETE